MKIAITGAHFTPAQAVIEELQKDPNIKLVYFGRKHTLEGDKALSLESHILHKLGVKFVPIIAGRLQRSITFYTIPSLIKIPLGVLQSFYLVLREKPDVVLSFGGYVSVPVVVAAWFLSIPVVTHEQTLVSGLATTINSWFADKVAVSFYDHTLAKVGKSVVTGNPIRKEILLGRKKALDSDLKNILALSKKEKLPLVIVTGGNQGSHVMNQAVAGALNDLTGVACVVHQTGDSKFRDFEELTENQKTLNNSRRYVAKKWIGGEELGVLLRESDLVISRAGINILLELALLGKPTLVIPIPYLYKNEQMVNAKFFKEKGLAQILPQKELTADNLLATVRNMLKNIDKLKESAKEAKSVVVPDAAKRLALETLILAKEHE